MPKLLNWCQDDEQKDIMSYMEQLCLFRYTDLDGIGKPNLYVERFFMQSHEHRRLGLILMMQFFRSCLGKNDVLGVPLSVVQRGMKCGERTARRIIKDGVDIGYVGETENVKNRSEKILYAKEPMFFTYMNKGFNLFHDPILRDMSEIAEKIIAGNKKFASPSDRPRHKERKKLEQKWLEKQGKKFKNGVTPR
jgi:hypothetical protein